MNGMLTIAEFTAVSNDAAAEVVAKLEAFFGMSPPPGGLLWYRIVQHGEHTTRIAVVQEWTDAAMQRTFAARPAFGALVEDLLPLLGGSPNSDTYSIVQSGNGAGSGV